MAMRLDLLPGLSTVGPVSGLVTGGHCVPPKAVRGFPGGYLVVPEPTRGFTSDLRSSRKPPEVFRVTIRSSRRSPAKLPAAFGTLLRAGSDCDCAFIYSTKKTGLVGRAVLSAPGCGVSGSHTSRTGHARRGGDTGPTLLITASTRDEIIDRLRLQLQFRAARGGTAGVAVEVEGLDGDGTGFETHRAGERFHAPRIAPDVGDLLHIRSGVVGGEAGGPFLGHDLEQHSLGCF